MHPPSLPAAFPAQTQSTALTPDEAERRWNDFYESAKAGAAKKGKRFDLSLATFKRDTECYHCKHKGCFTTVCSLKLQGCPP